MSPRLTARRPRGGGGGGARPVAGAARPPPPPPPRRGTSRPPDPLGRIFGQKVTGRVWLTIPAQIGRAVQAGEPMTATGSDSPLWLQRGLSHFLSSNTHFRADRAPWRGRET
jgi:hypothetical protein